MITCMRARASLNFGLIGIPTAELAAPESLRKPPLFSAFLNWILFIFAGNDNIHESLDEVEIQPDPTAVFHGNR